MTGLHSVWPTQRIKSPLGRKRNKETEEITNFSLSIFPVWCLTAVKSDTGSCRGIEVSQVLKASGKVSKQTKKFDIRASVATEVVHYCLSKTCCKGAFEEGM